jgi:Flp pilus assembly protein TadD
VWVKKKDYDRAVKDFEEALRLDGPDWIYAEFALLRAACPDADYRDGRQALELAKKACATVPKGVGNGRFFSALAAAYAEAGDFDEAVRRQDAVLETSGLHDDDRADYEARLRLYRQKQAYREQ